MTSTRRDRSEPGGLIPPAPRLDVTAFLSVWIALLVGISANQVVPGLGAIGSPAHLWALLAAILCVSGWLLPGSGLDRGRHPVRVLLFIYFASGVLSFAVAMSRSLSELETTGAYRALLTTFAMVGLASLVADGVKNRERLDTLLRRLVGGLTFVSVIGILQFVTGLPWQFSVPGLTWNADLVGVGARSIFNRPMSTAMHPIELSVVTAAALPIAIHYALYADTRRRRRNMATAAILIGIAMPLAVSRSGILALFVALGVLAIGWSWRRRLNALLVALVAVPVMWAAVPGLVGTFLSLFGNQRFDPSIQARIERGPLVMALVRERPWFGIGSGTFSVEEYFLLDNQVRVTMIETGIVGLVVLGLLLVGGIAVASIVARVPDVDPSAAHLGQAVAAAIAGLSISLFTFDALFYRILTGTLFLLLGVAGALWRFARVSELVADAPSHGTRRTSRLRERLPLEVADDR